MTYQALRQLLFRFSAEEAHHRGLQGIALVGALYRKGLWKRPLRAKERSTPFGKTSSLIGLAAGLDKNAKALWGWEALGFGFVEVGTATPRPQPGNPKPRLFRIPSLRAIVNRMGFNNEGSKAIAKRIRQAKAQGLKIPVGGNIGKNKDTSLEVAAEDYKLAAADLAPVCDYLVINVSSPNTPGLRLLQSQAALEIIVLSVREVAPDIPLFIKVAPDDGLAQGEDVIAVVKRHRLSGVIVGNTLLQRPAGLNLAPAEEKTLGEAGGLSGAPIFAKNLELARYYCERLKKQEKSNGVFMVIGVGGIMSAEHAKKYFEAGCDAVQIYSGLIYEGPALIRQIQELEHPESHVSRQRREGFFTPSRRDDTP